MSQWFTPPDHIKFQAQKCFGALQGVLDGSVAYLEPGGGGPSQPHTHAHNHVFFVLEGQAKVLLGGEEIRIPQGESFLVRGQIPHSVWNDAPQTTIMLGISLSSDTPQ